MNEYVDNNRVFAASWDEVNAKIATIKLENLQIVADYDNTMTKENEFTSWALFKSVGIMPQEYIDERNDLFQKYHSKELDPSISVEEKGRFMKEWTYKHLLLFPKYGLSKTMLREAVKTDQYMELREGFKNFLNFAEDKNVPFLILSAGVANTISLFMKYNNLLSDNVYIASNELDFDENEICIGLKSAGIIHTENKDEGHIPERIEKIFEPKKDAILLGDSLGDLKMVDESKMDTVLKIGFLTCKKVHLREEFMEGFDIVVESDGDTHGVLDYLIKKFS